jgi:hypothetical protein
VEKGAAAWEEIQGRAERLVEKADGFSQPQAVDRVLREHPDLYRRYMAEVEAGWAELAKADGGPALNTSLGVAGPELAGEASGSWTTPGSASARELLEDFVERCEDAVARGEDQFEFLAAEPAPTRKLVQAVLEASDEPREKAAESKARLRRRLEGLEAHGRKPRRVAKSEVELWDEIVAKSGASPRDPEFSRVVDNFLSTPEGGRLYRDYEAAYEARDRTMAGAR